MFERFTELARKSIFFARYEASQSGSPYIETEHLLLGLLRVDEHLRSIPGLHTVRKQIEEATPSRPKTSTSVDLPVSSDCRRAFEYAAEEADAAKSLRIETGHLILGLLRVPGIAHDTLEQHGVTLEEYRKVAGKAAVPARAVEDAADLPAWDFAEPAAPALKSVITAIRSLLDALSHFNAADAFGNQPLKRKAWTRKEALGHLVDSATAHRLWIARALTEPKVTTVGYPPEEWVALQQYQTVPWAQLIDLWVNLNQLIVHALVHFPEARLDTTVRIGLGDPVPLVTVLERYVEFSQDLVGQIIAKL